MVLARAAANSTLSEQSCAHFLSDRRDSPDIGPHFGNLTEGKAACKGKPVEKMFHVEHFEPSLTRNWPMYSKMARL
jgi:hypothetical protein